MTFYGKKIIEKKNIGIIQHLYLAGMAICAIGFLCPLFKALGQTANGFGLISKDFSVISAGILLIFIGAAAGAVLCFVKIKNVKLFKLIAPCSKHFRRNNSCIADEQQRAFTSYWKRIFKARNIWILHDNCRLDYCNCRICKNKIS